jgi:hypothetical protein
MSTRLLYHALRIRGYDSVRTDYRGGEAIFIDRGLVGPAPRRGKGDKSNSAAHNAAELAGESPVVGIDCLPT